MVDKGFVGKSTGVGENDFGSSGISCTLFLGRIIKYCVLIDDSGVISAERTFKDYNEEHRFIKLEEFISLSEKETVSSRFSIDWTKTFEVVEIPHRKQACLDCDIKKVRSACVTKPRMKCFECEVQRACISYLDLVVHKKDIFY